MKRVVFAVVFLALVAGGALVYQSWFAGPARSQTAAQQTRQLPVVPVVVATAARAAMPARLETIGTVQPITTVSIKSRIDGLITKVLVDDGKYVKAGDILFLLDSRAAEAQLHQAEAQLARDRVQLANAKRDEERYTPLLSKDFVSRQQYEQVATNAKALEAALQADEAAAENNRVQVSYYTIRSPIDGRVGTISLKIGNNVKANDLPLVTINQIKPIYVGFAVPQANLSAIRAAMAQGQVAVTAAPAGDSGPPEAGRLAFFDNAVDTATGTIALKSTFPNDQERLWPGLYVNVAMTLRVDADALVVPQAAVQVGQNTTYVYVAKPDDTAELRPVKVSRTIDGKSIIVEGLAEGERVVVDGQLRLADGSRLEIRAAQEQQKNQEQQKKPSASS